MLAKATGTLSDLQFVQAAASDDRLRKRLMAEFGREATALVEALASGQPHLLMDDAYDFLVDALLSTAAVYATFSAQGSEGTYPIEVRALGDICFVWAPEFDRVGPFASPSDAEAYVVRNWTDSLEDSEPVRRPRARARVAARQPAVPRLSNEGRVRLGNRWYSKNADGKFTAYRSSLLNGEEVHEAKELAAHLIAMNHSSKDEAACRRALTKAGWADVVQCTDQIQEERIAARAHSEQDTVDCIRPFVVGWLELHRGQHASTSEATYWAARAWISHRLETYQTGDPEEDVPLARIHHEALMLADLYRRHSGQGG